MSKPFKGTKLEPLERRCVVARPELKPGLVIIPDSLKNQTFIGYVVHVSPDCRKVKAGMRVLFGTYAGQELEKDRHEIPLYEKCTIMREEDALAIVEINKPFTEDEIAMIESTGITIKGRK